MNTNATRSRRLHRFRLQLEQSLRAWQAVGPVLTIPAALPREEVPTSHSLCDELACGECMLGVG